MSPDIKGQIRKVDRFQRERRWLGYPLAVFKKFGEDQGGYLAALIAYYGFFSLFPLLLVFVTVLGFVIGNDPQLQQKILSSALAQFPVIGDQIRGDVHSIRGSGIALIIGLGTALWAGTGVVQALQNAQERVWNVPVKHRPKLLKARLKALVMLSVLGVATIVATSLSGIAAGGGLLSGPLKALALLGSLAVNFGVFLVAFRVLTTAPVSWKDVVPGALVAAVAWGVLQALGNYIVGHQLRNASQTYGVFALVIGLLSWLYIGAQVTILAAEINVVRVRRLWPRGLQPPLTEPDERALRSLAKEEERLPGEVVDVTFDADVEDGQTGEAEAPVVISSGRPSVPANGRPPGPGAAAPVTREAPLPEVVRGVVRDTQRLLRQELQLARSEMAGKFRSAGQGAGALGAAGLIAAFAGATLVAALILGLATMVAGWLAGILAALLLAAIGGLLAVRGKRAVEQATPLVPGQAIDALASTKEKLADAWRAGSAPERVIPLPEAKVTPPSIRPAPPRREPPRY